MASENSAILSAASWHHNSDAHAYTVDVGISSDQFDQLATDASEECVDLAIRSAALTQHTGRTGDEYLILETSDGVSYPGTILDPDEANGLITLALGGERFASGQRVDGGICVADPCILPPGHDGECRR